MKRVIVIGSGGAGKSTFAKRLGQILNIKVIHLDALYWRPGWVEPPKDEWALAVDATLKKDSWIIDGNYAGTLEKRIVASDTIIFLDLPRLVCLWRVIRRAIKYRNQTRPDMAPDCQEQLNLEFIFWIWNYRKNTKPRVEHLLNECGIGKSIIWLQSTTQVEKYLSEVSLT